MNYYEALGIKSNASDDEIKKAFRLLNLELHPDKLVNKSEDFKKKCSDQLIKVRETYSILCDPIKRKIYDKDGELGLDQYKQKQEEEVQINEARERNKIEREERKKRLAEKKRKEEEERKRKELEELKRKEEEARQAMAAQVPVAPPAEFVPDDEGEDDVIDIDNPEDLAARGLRRIQIDGEEDEFLMDLEGNIYDL
jgi:curved DNA-binding protein CbpA